MFSASDSVGVPIFVPNWRELPPAIKDYDLPNVNGIEIARQTSQLSHRQQTPILMFTASSVDKEAYADGVDQFLRKPEDIHRVTGIIRQMLSS